MRRKEFIGICVENNIRYNLIPSTPHYDGTITLELPRGKVFSGTEVHYIDYDVEEPMNEAYDEVVRAWCLKDGIDDCKDPECWCHTAEEKPMPVEVKPEPKPERPKPKDTAHFKFNDGGRIDAGYKGHTGDCVCRSIAIVTGKPYQEVYDTLNEMGKKERTGKRKKKKSNSRTGVYRTTYDKYLKSLGYIWVATMKIGSGCTTHLSADQLPHGRLVLRVSRHVTAMVDGIIHDTFDPSREGTRCVYGYYYKPEN